MTRALTNLENAFINAFEPHFTERIKQRKAYVSGPTEVTLLAHLRAQGTPEEKIEQTLNNIGIITDPHDPNATPDPIDAAARFGSPRAYRPPSAASAPAPVALPATPAIEAAPPRRNNMVNTLIGMGVDIQPAEMSVSNIETQLLHEGRITEDQLATAYAQTRGVERVDLRRSPPDPTLKDLLPDRFVMDSEVVPYRNGTDGTLICVVSSMRTVFIGPRIEDKVHRKVEFVITTITELRAHIDRIYNQSATFQHLAQESERRARSRPEEKPEAETEDSAMAQTFLTVLREAINNRASDIHVQPTKSNTRVRMRVDGVLRDFTTIPGNLHRQFTNYIRVRGGISNTRDVKPQDAHMELEINGRPVNIRISILPTVYGAKTVMRLLSNPEQIIPLDGLNISPTNREMLDWGLKHKNGIIIISGPTGSGKTNTLYSITKHIDNPDLNITTIENPVEIRMDSVSQVQITPDAINEDMRFTDQEALRSVLRQDPDVILIGEMRDRETVRLGMQAAQTGHLVLATTHTNSAAESITRLKDLGANPYDMAPSVRLLIAQRLLRKPCPDCTTLVPAPAGTFDGSDIPASTPIRIPTDQQDSCLRCDGQGHMGRVAIQEILPVKGVVRDAIRENAPESKIVQLARQAGFRTLYEDALLKLSQGLTTLSEIDGYQHAAAQE